MNLRPATITSCVAAFLALANRLFFFVITQPYMNARGNFDLYKAPWFAAWWRHDGMQSAYFRFNLLQSWASILLAISLTWFFLAVYLELRASEASSAHG